MGSSPRARGAEPAQGRAHNPRGIIPARAGSSHCSTIAQQLLWDHPRARGEQCLALCQTDQNGGSSPRARGAVPGPMPDGSERGIIPARAGSRTDRTRWATCREDHPRARGEQSARALKPGGRVASSPRARGAVKVWGPLRLSPGIIPARGEQRPARAVKR